VNIYGVLVCGIGLAIIGSENLFIALGVMVAMWGYEIHMRPPKVDS